MYIYIYIFANEISWQEKVFDTTTVESVYNIIEYF